MKFLFTILLLSLAYDEGKNFVITYIDSTSVKASWKKNTEIDLAGYKVYYGKASRAYTIEISTEDTTLVISNLDKGETYYFAVTAFDTAGNESDYSNEVIVNIPGATVSQDTTLYPDSPLFTVSKGATKTNDPLNQSVRILALWGNLNKAKPWVKLKMAMLDSTKIQIISRGEPTQNIWPIINMAVNDTLNIVSSLTIDHPDYAMREFPVFLKNVNALYFIFPNDGYDEISDRNAFIRAMTIKIYSSVQFSIYDLDKNGVVDPMDWIILLRRIGLKSDHADYLPIFDLNNDGWIDGIDKATFARLSNFI